MVAALVLTPMAIWVAVSGGVIDRAVAPKVHGRDTPLLGGAAVYGAFAIAAVLILPLSKPLIGLLAGGLAAVILGVVDEIYRLSPLVHLVGQLVAAAIAITAGVGIVKTVSVPFGSLTSPGFTVPAAAGLIFTLLWIVGMMNTVNFLDGMDGLAAGVAALAAVLLAVWASERTRFFLPAITHQSAQDIILPVVLAGALFGFLPYNWHPARIFLGDSGAMFLGLALGCLAIIGPAKLGTALLVLVIPVLDVAWAIVRRQLRGRSFLTGDKQHVYHRMLEVGFGYTATVLILYFICFVLGVLDLFVLKLAKLVAFAALAAILGASFVWLEIRASRQTGDTTLGLAPLNEGSK